MQRRNFIKATSVAGLAALASTSLLQGQKDEERKMPEKTKSDIKILFQGDSITDGNRTRDNDWNHIMGHGYAYLIASKLWFEHPDKNLMFYNRGISGNRAKDLDARWKEDALDLSPDFISILIGVNDVLSVIKDWGPDPIEKYEEYFVSILEKTRQTLPDTEIIICEPFILDLGWVNEKTEIWHAELKKRQVIARKLAQKYNTLFVELQEPFNKACKIAPASYWIWDGVHPMPAGHELIAREWMKEVKKKIKFI